MPSFFRSARPQSAAVNTRIEMLSEGVLEKHYRVKDLAEVWHMSKQTVIGLFRNEPGVIKLPGTGKRTTLYIPLSVAGLVYDRISKQPLKPLFPSPRPSGVVRLSDGDGPVVKQPRHTFKIHSRQQAPHSERVA
jgi:hypothetical protein